MAATPITALISVTRLTWPKDLKEILILLREFVKTEGVFVS